MSFITDFIEEKIIACRQDMISKGCQRPNICMVNKRIFDNLLYDNYNIPNSRYISLSNIYVIPDNKSNIDQEDNILLFRIPPSTIVTFINENHI